MGVISLDRVSQQCEDQRRARRWSAQADGVPAYTPEPWEPSSELTECLEINSGALGWSDIEMAKVAVGAQNVIERCSGGLLNMQKD